MGFFGDFFDALTDAWGNTLDLLEPIAGLLGFADRRIYQWSNAASRIIAEDDIPTESYLTNRLIYAIRNNDSVIDAFILSQLTGPASSLRAYARYGESDYIYGLPEMGFRSPPIHLNTIKTLALAQITTDYTVGPNQDADPTILIPTMYDWGLAILQKEHSYTNQLVIGGNTYVYEGMYIDASLSICKARLVRYAVVGTPIVEYIDITDPADESYELFYRYPVTVVLTSILTAYEAAHGFSTYIANYADLFKNNSFKFIFLFPYEYSGTLVNNGWGYHPEMLDSPTGNTDNTDATKMLPIVPLRKNGVWCTGYVEEIAEDLLASPQIPYSAAIPAVDWFATSDKLMRVLNYDVADLVEQLKVDGDGNPNPDIDDVPEIFFICAVTPYSDNHEVLLYLYTYFKLMYNVMATSSYAIYSAAPYGGSSHIIKITEQNYNVTISFNYIRAEVSTGTVGEVGEIIRTFDIRSDIRVTRIVDTIDTMGSGIATTETEDYPNSRLVFKTQINETSYETLTIHGLALLTDITAEDGYQYGKISVLVEPDPADDTVGSTFLIPLSAAFLDIYGSEQIEQIAYRSFHIVFFASSYTDLEWHETASFFNFISTVITVVGFILSAYSLGAAEGAVAIIQQMLVQVVLAQVIKHILLTADLSDAQKAVLIALYAVAASKAGGGDSATFTVTNVLKMVTVIVETITLDLNIRTDKLYAEQEEENELYKELAEHNQDIIDGLAEDSNIDPMYLVIRKPVKYETTDAFMSRTLGSNTTEICMNYSDSYVDSMLDLDKITVN